MSDFYELLPVEPDPEWYDPSVLCQTPESIQLQEDTVNVEEGRIELNTFSTERQQEILNYYRFSGHQYRSKSKYVANRIWETLEIV